MNDGYEQIFTGNPLSVALVCPRCGALIAASRVDVHDEWHALVEASRGEGTDR